MGELEPIHTKINERTDPSMTCKRDCIDWNESAQSLVFASDVKQGINKDFPPNCQGPSIAAIRLGKYTTSTFVNCPRSTNRGAEPRRIDYFPTKEGPTIVSYGETLPPVSELLEISDALRTDREAYKRLFRRPEDEAKQQ